MMQKTAVYKYFGMMKKAPKFILALMVLLSITNCEKDDLNPEYPFTIVVKTMKDSVRATNVFVEILTTLPDNKIDMIGATDQNGEVSFSYDRDAVLQIRATRGRNPITWIGCNFVRLEPNKRVFQTVYVKEFDPKLSGCLEDR